MLDYGSILAAGRSLVPDMRQQMMQDEAFDMQRQQFAAQQQAVAAKQAEAQQQAQRQQAFQDDLEGVLLDGSPQAIQRLMLRYPEMSESIKPVWESMDERQRQTDLTATGSIYARAQAGDVPGAITMMEQRVSADRAAGQADPNDEAILAGLRSDNPTEQRAAIATIGIQLAALTGDKFSETYGRLNPTDAKTGVQKEYEWRVGQFGQKKAAEWLATQDVELVVGEPGAPIFDKRDFIRQRGGDPSGSQGLVATREQEEESARIAERLGPGTPQPVDDATPIIQRLFPNARITQTRRDPNSSLGRANPNSWHNRSGAAVDLAPIPGMTFDQFVGQIEASGTPVIEKRDEVNNPSSHATGPHWHVVLGQPGGGAMPRIASRQQYDRLPSGAQYIAPDGSPRRKP